MCLARLLYEVLAIVRPRTHRLWLLSLLRLESPGGMGLNQKRSGMIKTVTVLRCWVSRARHHQTSKKNKEGLADPIT